MANKSRITSIVEYFPYYRRIVIPTISNFYNKYFFLITKYSIFSQMDQMKVDGGNYNSYKTKWKISDLNTRKRIYIKGLLIKIRQYFKIEKKMLKKIVT